MPNRILTKVEDYPPEYWRAVEWLADKLAAEIDSETFAEIVSRMDADAPRKAHPHPR